ncbi:MAG: hypothetical protein M0P43_07155 [Arcobacteraceae bacterium]|nr:hypothetical protein [Arcobacteraceae bacterium]
MRQKKIVIEYWTDPDGDDFRDINEFVKNINQDYFLTLNKKRTDACGGGLYDFIIKITEDISLLELAKSYAEDGVKIIIGYSLKKIFDSTKALFEKNKEFSPSIEELVIDYKDCKVRIYNIYENGIEECFDDIMKELCDLKLADKKFFKKIKTIHLPIFNNNDLYKICDYRVKLNVDEPLTNLTNKDFFNYWGISKQKHKYVYDVKNKKVFKQKYYTQKTYDKIFDKAFAEGKLEKNGTDTILENKFF